MHCARTARPIILERSASGARATISIGSRYGCKPELHRRGRAERSFALSAARSLLFNAVLARRVEAGDWSQLAPGDLANLDGSGSHFSVSAVDDELRRRLSTFDIHPSGPLWGRGHPASQGQALEHELAVSREFAAVADLLAAQGLTQERRALRCAVRELSSERDAQYADLELFAGTRTIRHGGAARNMRFRSRPGTRCRRGRPPYRTLNDGFVPGQTPALIRDEQQKTMMSARQLGACHVQSMFRDRDAIGDPFGDVHGHQSQIADSKGLRPDVRTACRDELKIDVDRCDERFFQDWCDNLYFRIVGVVVGRGVATRRPIILAQIARFEIRPVPSVCVLFHAAASLSVTRSNVALAAIGAATGSAANERAANPANMNPVPQIRIRLIIITPEALQEIRLEAIRTRPRRRRRLFAPTQKP